MIYVSDIPETALDASPEVNIHIMYLLSLTIDIAPGYLFHYFVTKFSQTDEVSQNGFSKLRNILFMTPKPNLSMAA